MQTWGVEGNIIKRVGIFKPETWVFGNLPEDNKQIAFGEIGASTFAKSLRSWRLDKNIYIYKRLCRTSRVLKTTTTILVVQIVYITLGSCHPMIIRSLSSSGVLYLFVATRQQDLAKFQPKVPSWGILQDLSTSSLTNSLLVRYRSRLLFGVLNLLDISRNIKFQWLDFYITSLAKTLKKQQLQSITVTTRDVLGNYRFTVFRSCTEPFSTPSSPNWSSMVFACFERG